MCVIFSLTFYLDVFFALSILSEKEREKGGKRQREREREGERERGLDYF